MIGKDIAVAALVRAFFKYYVTGMLESQSRMNYDADEASRLLKDFVTETTTDIDLVRFACRTGEMFDVMVEEYKRNFLTLLAGHVETDDEHLNSYTRRPALGDIDVDLAENIVNRMASRAYELGKASQASPEIKK